MRNNRKTGKCTGSVNGKDGVRGCSGRLEILNKATDSLVGHRYEPIALLGTKRKIGTDHAILVKGTAVIPDAQPDYSIITITNVDGNAEITATEDLSTRSQEEGFTVNTDEYDLGKSEEANKIFANSGGILDSDVEPIAYIASKQDDDFNAYQFVARVTSTTDANAESTFALVTISLKPNGNVDQIHLREISFTDEEIDKINIA